MKTFVPNYYADFSCIAGDCRHSCCIGWEIDIDEESLARYQRIEGEIGRRLNENILKGDDGACFRLNENERCPFLNGQGLCELILELGADSLCQICADHPRFRNFFSDRTEIGLGLCCEAAARLILLQAAPARLLLLSDDGNAETCDPHEAALLRLRSDLIAALQERRYPLQARLDTMLQQANLPPLRFDLPQWAHFFAGLERLDAQWTNWLELLKTAPSAPLPCIPALELPLEQLGCYLLMRHLPGALEDGDVGGRIAYAALILNLLGALFALQLQTDDTFSIDAFIEIARMYSSEIEYSDENLYAILDELQQRFPEIEQARFP